MLHHRGGTLRDSERYRRAARLACAAVCVVALIFELTARKSGTSAGALRINRALSGSEFVATKTPRSRRKIELSNTARAALRTHRKRQLEEQMKEAGLWKDHGLVFPRALGTSLSHRNLLRSFKALLTRAGLPAGTGLYDLRHTCATLLLNSNVHPKYIQQLLGHASIAQTLDTYSHVL
jgi:integrase